jgi:tetratricopeptide (TPR) repeat protein
MKRFLVPGVPTAFSLILSLCTVGSRVGWQDSGFFLAGVKELGVLYAPGFILYLILCKTWTLLLGFVDFTLAVHLFSAACAAAAVGAIALAARELLRTQGRLFRVGAGDGELPAIVAGCLAACGFTFWSAALLAKGYALLYLILALLIWRMIRADETGKGSDFTIVAVLIGLAWAAHPSATTFGPAFLVFVASHRRTLGPKGIAWRSGVAAAAAIGPSLLLPLLAARHPLTMFGDPSSLREWTYYLVGGAFAHRRGTFGFEPWRALRAVTYLWEDFLGVGAALALLGLSRLGTANRRLLLGIGLWVLPSALTSMLFKIEGQQDLWLVAAWLPLHLAVAVGLASIPPRRARAAAVSLGVIGAAWAIAVNARDVSMRGYRLAEQFGRFHLEHLESGSVLLLESDDLLATTRYLQVVQGYRRDLLVVDAGRLPYDWYQAHLKRLDSRLKPGKDARSFAVANVSRERPVYFETAPRDLPELAPAGPLMRLAAAGEPNEPRDWPFPVRPTELCLRRERGVRLRILPDRLEVEPEAYERRWVTPFVRALDQQARWALKRSEFRKAADLFASARAADPGRPDPEAIHLAGACHYQLSEYDRAEPLLKQSVLLGGTPRQLLRSYSYLSTICAKQGRREEAARYHDQAMAVVRSDPELRQEFEKSRGGH